LKTIRVYVESFLRFNPSPFKIVVIEPNHKNEKKLRKSLDEKYKGLGQDLDLGELDNNIISLIGNDEYYNYVFFEGFIEHNPIKKKSISKWHINQ